MIGPEGDFTINELEIAKTKNFQFVTLGKTRLRAKQPALWPVLFS